MTLPPTDLRLSTHRRAVGLPRQGASAEQSSVQSPRERGKGHHRPVSQRAVVVVLTLGMPASPIPGRRQRGPTRLCLSTRCKSRESVMGADQSSKRVVLLGPSHHVYLSGIALSKFASYGTPIGDIPLDLEGAPCRQAHTHTKTLMSSSHRRSPQVTPILGHEEQRRRG